MSTYTTLFGGANTLGLHLRIPVAASRSVTFDRPGKVRIKALAGGGAAGGKTSGGFNARSGGNSSPWGIKLLHVAAADVLSIAIGAAGANYGPGGDTVVMLNNVEIMRIGGGEAGGASATVNVVAAAPVPAAIVTGADYWRPGLRGGSASFSNASASATGGGAAPDLLSSGRGRGGDCLNASDINAYARRGAIGADGLGRTATAATQSAAWADVSDWGVPSVTVWAGAGGGHSTEPALPGYAFVEFVADDL